MALIGMLLSLSDTRGRARLGISLPFPSWQLEKTGLLISGDGVLFALPPEMHLQPTQVRSRYALSSLTDQPQSIPRPTS